ncbi:hypothetical protein AGMMS49587_04810 [Spirochaetia bacterium]|nr:hypothetical protein AGMMS49587_04810 [Spirochaetia bacterium]
MNTTLLDTIKKLVSDQGAEILNDSKKANAYLSDLAAKEPKPQRMTLVKCLEYGFHTELQNTQADERERCKNRLAQRLHDEEGTDLGLCKDSLDLLEAVLMAQMPVVEEVPAEPEEATSETPAPESTADEGAFDQIATYIQAVKDRDVKIAELENEVSKFNTMKTELVDESETKKLLKGWLVAFIFISIIAVIAGVHQYNKESIRAGSLYYQLNQLQSQYNTLQTNDNQLNGQYNALQTSYSWLLSNWIVRIDSISVGNWGNNSWITPPGGTLTATQMRYLMPKIVYTSLISDNFSLDVNIIGPDGTIIKNNANTYTHSSVYRINKGERQSLELLGWGSANKSTYSAGTYTIEVWYKGVCLKSAKVQLN